MENNKSMSLFRKAGGGFLNGVNGVIESYKLDSKEWGEGDDAYTTLSVELLVKQDGAEEAVQQFLSAGFLYEGQTVSDDGLSIEVADDAQGGPFVREDSEFGKLLASIIEHGVAEEDFPADGSNFEAIVGLRYTFAKVLNKDRQMAAGKKKLGKAKAAAASEEEIMKAGRRQDKTDKTKFYNHDMLLVSAVLGKGEEKPAKGGKKAATPVATKAKGKKAADTEEDFEAADALLIDLLASAKGGVINKGSISSLIVRKALEDDMDNDARDGFRKLLANDEYLARQAGWTYDSEDKKQPITLAKGKKKAA